ncbi:restriction endonuclease subunit S [Kitasatospora sp. NPDC051984]|uniref:restriction endonuclease subunit S n=1 Tax=Kitasatospora sp. NPDC051984 TaxID=3364059 RepID=UPI0037C8FC05
MTGPAWVRLADLAELQPGFARRQTPHPDGTVGGIPVLRPPDVNGGELSEEPGLRVPDADAAGLARYRLAAGDILCVRTGRPGACAAVTPHQVDWLHSDTLFRIRPGSGVDPTYLAHYLSSPAAQDWILRRVHRGSGIPSITSRDLADLPVPLPGLDEQREAAEIMSAVTEKIAAHRRIAETASELRTALALRLFSAPK